MSRFTTRMARRGNPVAFTLVEIMIVVLIIGVLLAIAIPNFLNAREESRAKTCVANLREIETAKQQYLLVNNTDTFVGGTDLAAAGLYPTYIMSEPTCPAGGIYTIGDQTTTASCSLASSDVGDFGSTGTYPHYLDW